VAQRRREADAVEARIDALFATDPRHFVSARDALARELAASDSSAPASPAPVGGQSPPPPPRASEVKALRRPTVLAWALNRLARSRGDLVAALIDAGARLRAAHAAALAGGGRAALREADEKVNRILDELVEEARRAMEDGGHAAGPAALVRLRVVLRAAATAGGAAAEELRRGRFEREPEPAADDAFAMLAAAVPREAKGGHAERSDPSALSGAPHEAARRRRAPTATAKAAAAQRAREEREAARRRAEQEHRQKREQAAAARAIARMEAEVRRRESAVEAAERSAAVARAALDAARRQLDDVRRAAPGVPRSSDTRTAGGKS
jgi:hypothetical protein